MRIKELRTECGRSQRVMAELIGVTLPRYQKWEQRRRIPAEFLLEFSQLTNRPIEFIMTGGWDDAKFVERCRQAASRKEWSLHQLCKAAGVDHTYLKKCPTHGRNIGPLIRIADAAGVPWAWLITGAQRMSDGPRQPRTDRQQPKAEPLRVSFSSVGGIEVEGRLTTQADADKLIHAIEALKALLPESTCAADAFISLARDGLENHTARRGCPGGQPRRGKVVNAVDSAPARVQIAGLNRSATMTFKGYLAIVAGLVALGWVCFGETAPPQQPQKPIEQEAIEKISTCSEILRIRKIHAPETPSDLFSEKPNEMVFCKEGAYLFRFNDRKAFPLFCGHALADKGDDCFPGYCQGAIRMNAKFSDKERARCANFPTSWK